MLGSSQGAEGAAAPYSDAGVASTLAKEPFHTVLGHADVDGGTGRYLNRGYLSALCGGDPEQRQNPERIEYFDIPASLSSSSSLLTRPNNSGSGGGMRAVARQNGKMPLQVEPFSRSAAGKEIAEPSQTRSPAALSKSMHFLVEHFIRVPHTPLAFTNPNTVWGYLWDRFRGIRTSWIPQLPSPTTPDALDRLCASPATAYADAATMQPVPAATLTEETRQLAQWLEYTIAALSMAAVYMCRTPAGCAHFAVHNKKNFVESMSQCFTFLAVWYRAEMRLRHAEFISLLLILYGFQQGDKAEDRAAFCRFYSATDTATGEELWFAESAAESVNMARVYAELEKQPALMSTSPVRRVMRLLQCWAQRRWFDFFRICREEEAYLTPLQKSFLFQSFTYARFRAVLDLVLPDYSVYAKMRVRGVMPVRTLAEMLMMEPAHCLQFLRTVGVGDSLIRDTGASGDEWSLRLCDASTNSVVSSTHIKEQCETHKTDLFFPTYPEYFGFRVWHEAYERFGADAGLAGSTSAPRSAPVSEPGAGDEGRAVTSEEEEEGEEGEEYTHSDSNAEANEDDMSSDHNSDNGTDEEEAYDNEREDFSSCNAQNPPKVASASASSSPALSDAVLLRMEGCPINLAEVLEPYCPPYTPAMARLALADAPEVFFADIANHRRERLWTHVLRQSFERCTTASLPLGGAEEAGSVTVAPQTAHPKDYALLERHKPALLERLDARLPLSSGASGPSMCEADDGSDDDDDDGVSIASGVTAWEEEVAALGPYLGALRRRELGDTAPPAAGGAQSVDEAAAAAEADDAHASGVTLPLVESTEALIQSIIHSRHYVTFACVREEAAARALVIREEDVARGHLRPPTPPPPPKETAPVTPSAVLALPETGKTTVAPLPDDYVSPTPQTAMPCVVESPKSPTPFTATFAEEAVPAAATTTTVPPWSRVTQTLADGQRAAAAPPVKAASEGVEDVAPLVASREAPKAFTKLPPLTFDTKLPSMPIGTAVKRSRAEAEATDSLAEPFAAHASGSEAAPSQPALPALATHPSLSSKRAMVERRTEPAGLHSPTTPPSPVESGGGESRSSAEDDEASQRVYFSHQRPPGSHVANTTTALPVGSSPRQTTWDTRRSAAVAQLRARGAGEEVSSWQRLVRHDALTATGGHRRHPLAPPFVTTFFQTTLCPLIHQFLAEAATLLWVGARRVAVVQHALASTLLNADMSQSTLDEWHAKLHDDNDDDRTAAPAGTRAQAGVPKGRSLRRELRAREALAQRLCVGFSPALVPEFEWIAAEVDRLYAAEVTGTTATAASPQAMARLLHSLATSAAPIPAALMGRLEALAAHDSLDKGDRYTAFTNLIRAHGYAMWADPATGAVTVWDHPQTLEQRRHETIRAMDTRHLQLTSTFLFVSTAADAVVDVVAEEEQGRRRECGGRVDPHAQAVEAAEAVLRRLYTRTLERCVATLLARLPACLPTSSGDRAWDALVDDARWSCAHNSRLVTWCTPVLEEIGTLRDQYAERRASASTGGSSESDVDVSLRFGSTESKGKEFDGGSASRTVFASASLESPLVAQLGVADSRHRLVQRASAAAAPSHTPRGDVTALELTACTRVYGCSRDEVNHFTIARDGRLCWQSGQVDDAVGDEETEALERSSMGDAPATGVPQLSVILCIEECELRTHTAAGVDVMQQLARRAGQRSHSSGLAGHTLSGLLVLLTCDEGRVVAGVESVQQLFWQAFDEGRQQTTCRSGGNSTAASADAFEVDRDVTSTHPVPLLCVQPVPSSGSASQIALPPVQDALYQGIQGLLQAYGERLQRTVEDVVVKPPPHHPTDTAAAPNTTTTPRGKRTMAPSSFTRRAFATLA